MKKLITLLKRMAFDFVVNFLASSWISNTYFRKMLYNLSGIKSYTKDIRQGVYFFSNNIKIGEKSFINSFTKFYCTSFEEKGCISIGKNVYIGMGCLFTTITHEIGTSEQRAGKNIYENIIIGDGVWIGANCTILPGIIVEEGCIIAAGSTVNKNCLANGLYAGTPAKRVRNLN
ncbi:acyltransferase [Exiguobacterium mexicanum]|uniref:acyltransferase n=1 Tax=Exiguobacterium mexicanum TaxID=340146 RepID=UPI00384C9021